MQIRAPYPPGLGEVGAGLLAHGVVALEHVQALETHVVLGRPHVAGGEAGVDGLGQQLLLPLGHEHIQLLRLGGVVLRVVVKEK
jgi:hypothetical protein